MKRREGMFALCCLQVGLSTVLKPANKSFLWIVLLVISLTACAPIEPRDKAPQSSSIGQWLNGEAKQHKETVQLLNRFKALDSLPANQLKAAYKSAERKFKKQSTQAARLQLAWLLAMKNTSFRDVPRAAKLLGSKKKGKNPTASSEAMDGLAYLVRRMVEEQRFQQDQYRRVVEALNTERETSKNLATKIKDLTRIEESMIQRKPLVETELR